MREQRVLSCRSSCGSSAEVQMQLRRLWQLQLPPHQLLQAHPSICSTQLATTHTSRYSTQTDTHMRQHSTQCSFQQVQARAQDRMTGMEWMGCSSCSCSSSSTCVLPSSSNSSYVRASTASSSLPATPLAPLQHRLFRPPASTTSDSTLLMLLEQHQQQQATGVLIPPAASAAAAGPMLAAVVQAYRLQTLLPQLLLPHQQHY